MRPTRLMVVCAAAIGLAAGAAASACTLLAPDRCSLEDCDAPQTSGADGSTADADGALPDDGGESVVWTDAGTPTVLRTDAEHVFFGLAGLATGGQLVRIGPAGEDPTVLPTGDQPPIDLALDTANLYFTVGGDGRGAIGRVAKTNAAQASFLSRPATPQGLVIARGNVYWTLPDAGLIESASVAFTAPDAGVTTAIDSQNDPRGLATDANILVWTNTNGHEVRRRGIDVAGPGSQLYADDGAPTQIVQGGNWVAWTTRDGHVRAGTITGTSAVDIVVDGASLAIDGDFLYVATNTDVRKIPLAGGATTTIASGLSRCSAAMGVLGTYVYWGCAPDVAGGAGRIMRAPK